MSVPGREGLNVTSVVLVGFMGAGKSTVGEVLAGRLGAPFVDCDQVIEQEAGSIDEIFATAGEARFRALEREVVLRVLIAALEEPSVVALGGGAVTTAEVRDALRRFANVVWLEAPVDELWRRVGAGQSGVRPLARDQERFRRLLEERTPLYEDVARARVRCGGRDPQDVAAEVLRLLEGDVGPEPGLGSATTEEDA